VFWLFVGFSFILKKDIADQDILIFKYFLSAFVDVSPNVSQSAVCLCMWQQGRVKGVCVA